MNAKNSETNQHLQRFLRLPVAPALLPLFAGCVNPAKEITESMGAQQLTFQIAAALGLSRAECISVAVVGDGSTPRTAALIALTSGWVCTSIDPKLQSERWKVWAGRNNVRLTLAARKAQEVDGLFDVVVAVHAHVSAPDLRRLARPGGLLITLPCCVPHVGIPTTESVDDPQIMSAHRTFFVEQL